MSVDPNPTSDQTPTDPPASEPPAPADPPAAPEPKPGEGTDWKAEAKKWESRSKENKTALDKTANEKQSMLDSIAQALGLKEGDKPDPDKLASELTAAQREARATRVENAVLKASATHGADAARLTDSRTFMASMDELDPSTDDFTSKVADAIKAAVEANPTFKVGKPTARPDVSALKPGASPSEPVDDEDAEYRQFYPDKTRK